MIRNHFADSTYTQLAIKELGLVLYPERAILASNFRNDIEVGEYFLQYRRPGYPGPAPTPTPYSETSLKRLPSLIRGGNLTHRCVGYDSQNSEAKVAFRIFRVKEILASNEFRVMIEASSIFSSPDCWSFETRYATNSSYTEWRDTTSSAPGSSCRQMSFKKGSSNGVIGKFNKKTLQRHILEVDHIRKSFYPLFRALISDEAYLPVVVEVMQGLTQKADLDRIVP